MKVVQILTPSFSNISNMSEIELGAGEKMTLIQVIIGDVTQDFQINATLADNAKLNVRTAILARNNSKLKYNYHVEHCGAHSVSNFNLISSLSGQTQKETNMIIHFCKGAIGAHGNEKEMVILSDHAKNISYPIIDCDEENVVGNHSLSSGHIDETQLEYLRIRGFPEEQARNIITRARVLDILSLIDDDDKLQYIYEALNE